MNGWYIIGYSLSFFTQINTLSFVLFWELEIWVSDSRLDLSSNCQQKSNIHVSEPKFWCLKPDKNQNSKI